MNQKNLFASFRWSPPERDEISPLFINLAPGSLQLYHDSAGGKRGISGIRRLLSVISNL
jgi:hypothetical protein